MDAERVAYISVNTYASWHYMVTLRNNIAFFLFTFIFITSSFAQMKIKDIKTIRKELQAINSDTTLKMLTLKNEEFLENMTDGGGELTGYYKGNEVVKINQWVGLSNGSELIEFYFKNGQLIFVYEKFNSFVYDEKKNQFDFTKTQTTFQGRYYFKDNKLNQYETNGHNRFEDDTIDVEKTLLTTAKENLNLLNRKK